MSLPMTELVECFERALVEEAECVGVLIKMPGFEKDEIIINSKGNFAGKMAYYHKTYDENLEHKHAPGISIVGCAFGNSLEDLETKLLGKHSSLSVEVNVTGGETFGEVLEVLKYAFQEVDEETKEVIYEKLEQLIGNTHDIREFERELK